jgi:diacylglycerol kinase (ATP)
VNPRKLKDSFRYALEGIRYCFLTQRNMKIHMAVAVLIVVFSLLLKVSRFELILIFVSISMVITCELINTAIERAVDTATLEYHPLAKIAKDVAAGAVLVSAVNSVIVGILIFPKYIVALIESVIK